MVRHRSRARAALWLVASLVVASLIIVRPCHAAEPRLLAHYMPWYATAAVSGRWGWHWTMDRFDPEPIRWDGTRKIAAHDTPLIGPYDSGDDHALECHVLLMKIAGLDGVIVDWYGTSELNDHPQCHRNTQRLIPWLRKAGLSFAVCYEDQAVKSLPAGEDSKQAERDLRWAEEHFFGDPLYVRHEGRPLLLVFGPQHVHWTFSLESRPLVLGLPHLSLNHGLDGSFTWPPVADGKAVAAEQWREQLRQTYADERTLAAVAFPGFHDIYREAGVRESYGSIDAREGRTLTESLTQAIESGKPFVQVATWNDYGEGTMIEPTRSRGYRSLEALPRCGSRTALRLPVLLYTLRKRGGDAARLDEAARLLFASDFASAEKVLAGVGRELGDRVVDGRRLLTDVLYREGPDLTPEQEQRCRLDISTPASSRPFPTVVWFHGGGLTQGEKFIPRPLLDRDVAVVAVNYRRAPEAAAPAFIEDAAAAIAWTFKHIADFGGDPDRIVVSGHSAGAYLGLLCGLDRRWLARHGVEADRIAGLAPLSPQVITHFTIRAARGIPEKQPVIDDLAPLFHVRKDAPPILLVTGDREQELLGRYEECSYFWRMMKLTGHPATTLHELKGFDHGGMAEPSLPILLRFIEEHAGGTRAGVPEPP